MLSFVRMAMGSEFETKLASVISIDNFSYHFQKRKQNSIRHAAWCHEIRL